MSPAQYANKVKGIESYSSKQAVQYRIHEGLPLLGVIKQEIILGRNVLTVNTSLLRAKNSSKKLA